VRSKERKYALEGAFNFRDLGGLPTGDGRETVFGSVFRSDTLDHLTTRDVHVLVHEIGVRSVIDLRAPEERMRVKPQWAEESSIELEFVHLPLVDEVGQFDVKNPEELRTMLARRYMSYLELGGDNIVAVLELIARNVGRCATVIHCNAGKDRTGVVVAILLGLLGVVKDAIVADYVATDANMERILARMREKEPYRERVDSNPVELYQAKPHTMELFLEALDKKAGGIEGWARAHGLSEQGLQRLRTYLVSQ